MSDTNQDTQVAVAAEEAAPQNLEEQIVGDVPAIEAEASDAPPAATEEAATGEKSTDAPKPDGDHVPTEAMIAVRRERQRAQEEAAYLRGQLEALQRQQAPAQQQPSQEDIEREFYANPVGFTQSVAQQAATQAVLRERQQRATVSEQRARAELADYDDVVQGFYAAASQNPALVDELAAQMDPARWAYEYAKKQQSGPVDIEAIKAQAIADYQASLKKTKALTAASQTPKTQAGATGAGKKAAPGEASSSPLEGLFKF